MRINQLAGYLGASYGIEMPSVAQNAMFLKLCKNSSVIVQQPKSHPGLIPGFFRAPHAYR